MEILLHIGKNRFTTQGLIWIPNHPTILLRLINPTYHQMQLFHLFKPKCLFIIGVSNWFIQIYDKPCMTCMCEEWSVLLSQSAQMALFSVNRMMKLISLGLLVLCFNCLCYGVSNAFFLILYWCVSIVKKCSCIWKVY